MGYYSQIAKYINRQLSEDDPYVMLDIYKLSDSFSAEPYDVFETINNMLENNILEADPEREDYYRLVKNVRQYGASKSPEEDSSDDDDVDDIEDETDEDDD